MIPPLTGNAVYASVEPLCFNPKELGIDKLSSAGPAGFMDYTDDDCAPASLRTPSPLVAYNGHAGLGANLASQCLPEVDDEVLVAFEHGEPRRPCLVASLWNSGDQPAEMSR